MSSRMPEDVEKNEYEDTHEQSEEIDTPVKDLEENVEILQLQLQIKEQEKEMKTLKLQDLHTELSRNSNSDEKAVAAFLENRQVDLNSVIRCQISQFNKQVKIIKKPVTLISSSIYST